MPKNKPRHKKAGAKSASGPASSRASDKVKAQKDGARAGRPPGAASGGHQGKVVPLAQSGRGRKSASDGRAAAAAPAKRLRFIPPAAAERLGQLGNAAGQAWQRLLIRLRGVAPPDNGAAGTTARSGSSGRAGARLGGHPAAGKAAGAAAKTPRGNLPAGSIVETVSGGYWIGPIDRFYGHMLDRCAEFMKASLPPLQRIAEQAATYDGMMAVLLAIMLFYPPYLRGLFFSNELLPTHMLTAAVFALFAFYKLMHKELVFLERPLDYAVFILLGLYVTSTIGAVSVHDALLGVLKMANYAAIYWLLAQSVRSLSGVRGFLGVWLASGAGVSLLGWGTAIGTFSYNAAFTGGRLSSSLQYPNSLASFETAINLLGLYLWNEYRRHKVLGSLLAVANYLLFLAILGSQSRGGLLIYPVGLVLLLIGLGRDRWRALGLFAMQLVASLAVISGIMANANAQTHTAAIQLHGWLWLLAGAVLVSLFHLSWLYYTERARQPRAAVSRPKPWVAPAAAALVVVILAGAGFGLWRERAEVRAFASKAAPGSVFQRLGTISTGDINLLERESYSRDALKIMTSSPLNALLGAGGGGWNAIYHKFQSYLYFSTEVHDHFLQVGVETGFPGLLDFLLIWAFFILTAWNIYRLARAGGRLKTPEGVPAAAWALLSAAVALGLAAAIDFNLSLGAVSLLLYGMFGLMAGLDRLYGPAASARAAAAEVAAALDKQVKNRRRREEQNSAWKMPPSLQGMIVGALALVFFFTPLVVLIGMQYSNTAAAEDKSKDTQQAITDYQQAISHDVWDPDYRSQLAADYMSQVQQDEQQANGSQTNQSDIANLLSEASEQMSAAVRENSGDASIAQLYAEVLFQNGNLVQGLSELRTAVALQPMVIANYQNLASGYFEGGRYLLDHVSQTPTDNNAAQERQAGQNYLEQILTIPKQIQERAASITPAEIKMWAPGQPLLTVSPQINLEIGKAYVLLGQYQQADAPLAAAVQDSSSKPEAQLFQGLSLQQQGQAGEGQALIDGALKAQPDLQQELGNMQPILTPQKGK